MALNEGEVLMVQVDGTKRQVFIKFREYTKMHDILQSLQGGATIRHSNGEITSVRIEAAGLGIKKVRLANLPPEIADRVIKTVLEKYGEVKDTMAETWGRAYRYPVNNGMRAATMALVTHIPSHLIVEGHRSLVSYDGQPTTCYGCNAVGHMYMECPKRKRLTGQGVGQRRTWADVVTRGEPLQAQMELVSEGRKDDTRVSNGTNDAC
jgi:hypothetical protein